MNNEFIKLGDEYLRLSRIDYINIISHENVVSDTSSTDTTTSTTTTTTYDVFISGQYINGDSSHTFKDMTLTDIVKLKEVLANGTI